MTKEEAAEPDFRPNLTHYEEGDVSQMLLEDGPTITGHPVIVEPLYAMDDREKIVGFQWHGTIPQPPGEAEIVALRQQLEEARERNLIANNRADNAEADATKARATALEDAWEAVGAALSTETQAVQRRARKAIRSLAGKSASPDEADSKPHISKNT